MGIRDRLAQGGSRGPEPISKDEIVPLTQLVVNKQYTQIVQTIKEVAQQIEDPATAALVTAVQQLCVICQQGEASIAHQRDALAQSETYQQVYHEQLTDVMKHLALCEPVGVQPIRAATRPPLLSSEGKSKRDAKQPPIATNGPKLAAYMLGEFRLYQNDHLVEHCSNAKGMAILKYLLRHRHQPVSKEILMAQFWPDSTADSARNSLNVAIFSLRKALRVGFDDNFSHIIFRNNAYSLNSEMAVWVDVEAFEAQLQDGGRLENEGDWETAVSIYQAAESLYQGPFLAEERYETWVTQYRTHLQDSYLQLLEKLGHYYFEQHLYSQCIATCQKILAIDGCYEEAHRWLMSSYYQQGQRNLALRQYHRCQMALANDLDVEPMPETVDLYEQIRRL